MNDCRATSTTKLTHSIRLAPSSLGAGPKIRQNDLAISDLMKRFCKEPVFLIVDVRVNNEEIPTSAYMAVEEVQSDGKEMQQTFIHLNNDIGAFEAEEVGVEHLLRDINDPTVSSVATQIKHKIAALETLSVKLLEMKTYLDNVLEGKVSVEWSAGQRQSRAELNGHF